MREAALHTIGQEFQKSYRFESKDAKWQCDTAKADVMGGSVSFGVRSVCF